MLKEKINRGAKIYFDTMECSVLEVLSDNRLKLSVSGDDGQVSMPPLFFRSSCSLYTENGIFRTAGEVLERYKSENLYVIELELTEGLYRVNREQQSVLDCEENALFASGGESAHMDIIVKSVTANGLVFCLPEGRPLSEEQLEKGQQYGEVTIWQMCLGGRISDEAAEAGNRQYAFQFVEFPVDIQKKLTENILLGSRKL